MSDGMFYAYIGALVVSALVLAFLAVRSSGTAYRIVQAIFAAGFLGYAGYLLIANPPTVTVFFYAFALPILAVIRAVPFGSGRRGAPPSAPLPYASQGAFAPGQPVSPAGFPPSTALFAPQQQPVNPAPPAVDPGSYRALPSGLAGHQGPDHALPSGRPSGLPGSGPETVPSVASAPSAAPANPSTRPSGLPPRRVPTHSEPAFAPPAPPAEQTPAWAAEQTPAHIEFTQQLVLRQAASVQDVPAGPQPLYPQHPAPAPPNGRPMAEQAPGHADPGSDHAPHGYLGQHATSDQQGRHSAHQETFEQPAYDAPGWQPETAAYPQTGYRPAHGEHYATGTGDGSAAYPQEPGRHEQPEHPADWPPFRQ